MTTGNNVLADLADLVPEFTNSGAEQTRALRLLNAEKDDIEHELARLDSDVLLKSSTWATVADRVPNRYSLPTGYIKYRYLERVVDDSTGDYDRIWPIHSIAGKQAKLMIHDRFDVVSVENSGKPVGYMVGNDFVHLEPISDSAYTVREWFLGQWDAIEATADVLIIPDVVLEAIIYGARVRLHERLNYPTGEAEGKSLLKRQRAVDAMALRQADGPRYMNTDEKPVEEWA